MRIIKSHEFVDCLDTQWPKELHKPIRNLILSSFTIFWKSTRRTFEKASRTEVSHVEFVGTLDMWLDKYSDLEDRYSHCPFKLGMLLFHFVSSHLFTIIRKQHRVGIKCRMPTASGYVDRSSAQTHDSLTLLIYYCYTGYFLMPLM